MRMRTKPRTVTKLPPELWEMIFDEVIGFSISPANNCDEITFPAISSRLYTPWEYPPTGPVCLRNLRLVCREFNAILRSPSHFFLENNYAEIPLGARAVYIRTDGNPKAPLQQLLAQPTKSQRVVALDLPLRSENGFPPVVHHTFTTLCRNARLLSSIRSLTMEFYQSSWESVVIPQFWGNLHDAFPNLTCLVLRHSLKTEPELTSVIFERVEVLVMKELYTNFPVHLPALRHAAFQQVRSSKLAQFGSCERLESLLIGEIDPGTLVEWKLFPRLRLLGIPGRLVEVFDPLPPSHPLRHLYIYVGTTERDDHNQSHHYQYKEMTWLKQTIERLPAITRITLEFPKRTPGRVPWLAGHFSDDNLGSTGFSVNYTANKTQSGARLLVMERSPPPPTQAPEKKGFRAGWDRFRQFASEKLHFGDETV